MVQVFTYSSANSVGNNNYGPLLSGLCSLSTSENGNTCVVGAACSISNILFRMSGAPTAGKSYTFTVRVNGSNTAHTCTIADLATTGTIAGPIAFAAGDRVSLAVTTSGSPLVTIMRSSFVLSTSGRTCVYFGGGQTDVSTTEPLYNPLFQGSVFSNSLTYNRVSVMPCDGTITGYYVNSMAGTTAYNFDFVINKNGVDQDGSGGTPDTRLTCSGNTNSQVVTSTSFSLSVVAGDIIYFKYNNTSGARSITWSPTFVPSSGNKAPVFGNSGTLNTTAANRFRDPINPDSQAWNSSESNTAQCDIPANGSFWASDFWVALSVAPGGATTHAFTLRKSTVSTAVTLSITGAAVVGSDLSNRVRYDPGQTIGLLHLAGSTPAASVATWSYMADYIGNKNTGGNTGKKGGGGGTNIYAPGGTTFVQLGNPGIDPSLGG
jgi:hypothetical protein